MSYLRDLTARLRWTVDDRALDRSQRRISNVVKSVSGALAAAGVASELKKAADASIDFARTLSDLQSLLPGQTERVEELGAGIRKLAVQVGGDAVTMSKATYQIISAVGDTTETLDSLAVAQTLANAAVSDAATAFDLVSAVTLAYGDASLTAQKHVSDLAIRTVQLGKTTLPELTAAVGRAAPAFAALGVSQEELFGVTAGLAGVSGSTAEAMTQMSAIAAGMTNRTKEMDKAFKTLGVKTAAELISKKGLVGALVALRGTSKGTAEELTKMLGRIEAVNGANLITGKGAERVATSLREMGKAGGAAAASAEAVRSGAGRAAFDLDKMNSQAAEMQLKIGDRVVKPLAEARKAVLDLATALTEDLTQAMDIFSNEADAFAESPGFKAFHLLRSFAAGLGAVADLAGAGITQAQISVGEAMAVGENLAVGDTAGAGAAYDAGEKETRQNMRRTRLALSLRGSTIAAGFGSKDAAENLAVRGELARAGLAARSELARLREEKDLRRGVRGSRGGVPFVGRSVTASVGTINIALNGNATADDLQSAVRNGVGEGWGDAISQQVPDPTGVW